MEVDAALALHLDHRSSIANERNRVGGGASDMEKKVRLYGEVVKTMGKSGDDGVEALISMLDKVIHYRVGTGVGVLLLSSLSDSMSTSSSSSPRRAISSSPSSLLLSRIVNRILLGSPHRHPPPGPPPGSDSRNSQVMSSGVRHPQHLVISATISSSVCSRLYYNLAEGRCLLWLLGPGT
ncbi:hypothetical protein Tco_0752695 [Tanacetum coccineum]|uniref:Uncharacterized protein n=1 Tax=Tanacetum coccineum TaxID=301880 RepID=A0ABQ4Z7K5_9ASTR